MLFAFVGFLFFFSEGRAQTTLSAGEIAIIAMNCDGDDSFSFVLLRDITNGTVINFAESGWLNAGGFRGGGSGSEGTVTWTASSDLTCGTEVAITSAGTVASTGSTSVNGSWALSTSGDQILAYQGPSASPTFIYAINNEGAGVWQADATSTTTSALPTGLTNGSNAVAVNEADNVKYDCSTTTPVAASLAAISNNTNWLSDNTTPYAVPINCGFTCSTCTGPTAQASFTSITSINSTDFTINFTAGTGGNGRIVVVGTSAIASSPTSGTTYTANTVFGSGTDISGGSGEYVVYDNTGTSVTVTGLTSNTTYYVAVFEYTTGGATDPCYDASTVGNTGNATTTCGTAEPATNASAYVISDVACNGFLISWTSPGANAGSLVVIKSGSDVTTDPVDGTTYTASTTFGSGTDIGTSEFVVYDGNATSTWVYGLSASTTYYINIFEYNGTGSCINYRTSDEVSSNETTTACNNCPYITMALINSCDVLPCTEGDNEMIFLNSQDYVVSTSSADVTLNYGSTSPAPNTYADSFTANTGAITAMNADVGCTGIFVDATTVDFIPPSSAFLIVNSTICADAFDWSSICGAVTGNVYVMFSDDATWTSAGQFSNGPAGNRYFRTILGGCTVDYDYDGSLPAGDGAAANWLPGGGTADSYETDGCSLPASSLPVALLNFSGYGNNSTNYLEWTTASEINNDYFEIERSDDGFHFEAIGNVYGSGTTTVQQDYSYVDENPLQNLNYYRLKQVDFNGEYGYSNTIVLNNDNNDISIIHSNDILHIATNKDDRIKLVTIYNALGQIIYTSSSSNYSIHTNQYDEGIYLIQVKTENSSIIKKIKF